MTFKSTILTPIRALFVLAILSFQMLGCGSSDPDVFVLTPANFQGSFGRIEVNQVLLRALPANITQQRFTGFNAEGAVVYGPQLKTKAAQINLETVPTTVVRLQIEYLEGNKIVGLGNVPVVIQAGETTVINDPPWDDVVSAVETLTISPLNANAPVGTQVQYTAKGTLFDGTVLDLSTTVDWTSSSPAVAGINTTGRADALTVGSTNIQASVGSASAGTTLNVVAAQIVSIELTPANPVLPNGTDTTLTATATLTNGLQQDVTATAMWDSVTPATATVDNAGNVTSVAPGTTEITATLNGVVGSTTVTVTNATIASIAVSPETALSAPGAKRQYTAVATLTDGTTADVTSQVTWSSDTAEVFIANDNLGPNNVGEARLQTAAVPGTSATITATLGAEMAQSTLNIGRFLYVTSTDGEMLTPYLIGAGGQLSANGAALATGRVSGVAMDPSGEFLYVAQSGGVNTISSFTVGPDGLLTPLGGPIATGDTPFEMAVTPNGQFLYVANYVGSSISGYQIGLDGTLTSLGAAVPTGGTGRALSIDPTGQFLYVANENTNSISLFTIGADGQLAANGADILVGNFPSDIEITPSGEFLYVVNFADSTISYFTVQPDGSLTFQSTFVSAGFPERIGIDPSGQFAYVPKKAADVVSSFLVNGDGTFTMNGPDIPAGDGSYLALVDPSGRFVYVVNQFDSTLSAYTVNPDGTLAANGAALATGATPLLMVVSP